jgi:hypothetical protein
MSFHHEFVYSTHDSASSLGVYLPTRGCPIPVNPFDWLDKSHPMRVITCAYCGVPQVEPEFRWSCVACGAPLPKL